MQKKIIALAIASAMTVPALAYAEATVYGQANLSIDMVDDGHTQNSVTNNQLNSNTSRLGLKGSEDLGGGLSAVWQVEGTLSPDMGATGTSLFNRNNFLGLKSDSLGTALLGKIDTPYKTATRRLDLFGDGIADNRGSQVAGATANSSTPFTTTMMGGGHDARLDNVIAYMSPSMSGMSVALATVFGGETGSFFSTTPNADPKKGSAYSLAGMYDQGPFYATLAYQTLKVGSSGSGSLGSDVLNGTASTSAGNVSNGLGGINTWAADDETTAIKLGGSYTMDAFMVGLVWEDLSSKVSGLTTPATTRLDVKSTNMYFSGKFNISATDAVKLAYTMRGEQSVAGTKLGNNADQITIGYDHAMSKATTVYALYSAVSEKLAGEPDPTVLSLGMKHSF